MGQFIKAVALPQMAWPWEVQISDCSAPSLVYDAFGNVALTASPAPESGSTIDVTGDTFRSTTKPGTSFAFSTAHWVLNAGQLVNVGLSNKYKTRMCIDWCDALHTPSVGLEHTWRLIQSPIVRQVQV